MNPPLDYRKHPILYVDDERSNLIVFRHNFEDDFTIFTAENGEDALQILAEKEVAVLLADQRMPSMTGVALAERVRSEHPEVVRMILTAYSDINAAIDAINRGQVSRYITKPWRRDELSALLRGGIEVFVLNAMVRELQLKMMRSERLALLGFLAAGIAHDLKSPLGALSSNLETLEGDVANLRGKVRGPPEVSDLTQEMGEIVRDCREETQQIAAFVDTIRLHVKEAPARQDPIDLVKLADSTVKLCKGEILHHARLTVEHEEVPPVEGDAAQLGQVILNLLVNAAQAIEGKPQENRIRLHLGTREGKAVIEVSDTGKGIPREQLPQIFDPFFTTKGEGSGTGLGLAIVREIVRRHRGEISVESQVGKGTTFTVSFPAAS
jgi:signal transduction histidine kinase